MNTSNPEPGQVWIWRTTGGTYEIILVTSVESKISYGFMITSSYEPDDLIGTVVCLDHADKMNSKFGWSLYDIEPLS